MEHGRARLVALAASLVAVSIAVTVLPTPATPVAEAFGTYNAFGQQAEHERITRVLSERATDGPEGPRFEQATLDVLAGTSGVLGGVGAPDNPLDSSLVPIVGLGPGKKHCDDGDYLEIPGYPQTRAAAESQLRACIDYFEQLMSRAVAAAGGLVAADLSFAAADASMNCEFDYRLSTKESPKCQVLNAFGRALHLVQDFWTHSNWGDTPAPGGVTITNPPGLGRSDVPPFLRYPLPAGYSIPEGLISGCDDSADNPLKKYCPDRVAHSSLAKDNGTINPDTGLATPTDKYPRGLVGTNFQDVVSGARLHTSAAWIDLQLAIKATYGDERGRMIIDVLRRDSGLPCDVPDTRGVAQRAKALPCIRDVASQVDRLTITTTWRPVAGATYRVKVSDVEGNLPPRWTPLARTVLVTKVPEPGVYLIRIQAVRQGKAVTKRYDEPVVVAGPAGLPPICVDNPEYCKG